MESTKVVFNTSGEGQTQVVKNFESFTPFQGDRQISAIRINQVQLQNRFPLLLNSRMKGITSSGLSQAEQNLVGNGGLQWWFKLVYQNGSQLFTPAETNLLGTKNPGFVSLYQLSQFLTSFINVTSPGSYIHTHAYFQTRFGQIMLKWTSSETAPILLQFPPWFKTLQLVEATQYPFIQYYSALQRQQIKVTQLIDINIIPVRYINVNLKPYVNNLYTPHPSHSTISHTFATFPLAALYGELNTWTNDKSDPITANMIKLKPEVSFSQMITISLTDQTGSQLYYDFDKNPIFLEIEFFREI